MSFRRVAGVVWALALTFCAVAIAAALPKAHTQYFYIKHGAFSITLTSSSSSKQIIAGKPMGASAVLVVCPKTSTGAVNELQLGFSGAKLKQSHGHYGFGVTYTEHSADMVTITPVFGHITHVRASASVTGTVKNSKLIQGTVSVTATGCSLPKSTYKAAHS